MDCTEFLASHSEFFDGVLSGERARAFSRHLAACRSCARYHEVVRQGRELLRSLPPIEPSYDFYPRLQHRLYHLMDAAQSQQGSRASGTSTAAALAIALAMTIAAWSPLVRAEAPQLDLPAIVIDEPPPPSSPYTFPAVSSLSYLQFPSALTAEAFWSRSNMLLYLYSPLGWQDRQARSAGLIRTAVVE